jgi:hypothetical protein
MDAPTSTTVYLSCAIRTPEDLERVAALATDLACSGRGLSLRFNLTPLDAEPTVTIHMSTPHINETFITMVLSEALLYDFQIFLHASITL